MYNSVLYCIGTKRSCLQDMLHKTVVNRDNNSYKFILYTNRKKLHMSKYNLYTVKEVHSTILLLSEPQNDETEKKGMCVKQRLISARTTSKSE